MVRSLRIEFAGVLYQITTRGRERRRIFFTDQDCTAFRQALTQVCSRFQWLCHVYCLMGNHYHLLIENPEGNPTGTRQLNGIFAQPSNRTHQKVSHLFHSRFKGILVQKGTYLLELARYIVPNPMRARMVCEASERPWSNYRAAVGLAEPPAFLVTDWLLSVCGGDLLFPSMRGTLPIALNS